MLKLNEVREKLKDVRVCIVARQTGLPHWKIRHALKIKNPPYLTVEKLSDYIERRENESAYHN